MAKRCQPVAQWWLRAWRGGKYSCTCSAMRFTTNNLFLNTSYYRSPRLQLLSSVYLYTPELPGGLVTNYASYCLKVRQSNFPDSAHFKILASTFKLEMTCLAIFLSEDVGQTLKNFMQKQKHQDFKIPFVTCWL